MSKTASSHKTSKTSDGGKDKYGMTPAMWARLRSKTNAEVEAAARTDPDNPPMTKAEAAQMRRISIAKHVRQKLGLSQEDFAKRFAIPLGTLRDWEQHRTEPDQTSVNYLRVILANPKAVVKALEPA